MPDLSKAKPGWYCFQGLAKREHLAATILNTEEGIEAFAPRIRYPKKTRRGKVNFTEALFPGYLFVRCDPIEHYRWVMSTQGIRGIVSYGLHAPRVPDTFIEDLRMRMSEEDLRDLPAPIIVPGTIVNIVEGPFKDLEAMVTGTIPGKDRVRILLDFLGRELEVELSPETLLIEAAAPKGEVWE